ncbi:hypothetical protein [Yeosuana sp.]|uniref:hypothetical protein n=1 Tax=Yeosuana sp. TaxID=2529388 RepID=UPI0040550F10
MKPQILSKRNLTILSLFFVILSQAQTTSKSTPEKSNVLPIIEGSAGLNNTTNEIDMIGEVSDYEELAVTEKGFVYSTSENLPTISDSKISVESGDGTFSEKLTDLISSTLYYIRPYAINAKGVAYGSLSIIDTSTQSNIDINLQAKIKTYPNPSTNYISLAGLMETKNYIIYNTSGKELARGSISYNP